MKKKVLVFYYSQTGQLKEIVDSFLASFSGTDISVEIIRIKPQNDFSFPWNSDVFFNAMPETVLAVPVPLEKFQLREQKYDLVVFAYQPWYLSLSIPANSMLATDEVKKILKDTQVVTLIGARNMWISSQEKLKKILNESGAKLVGNIALVDRNPNLISAVTIIRWLMYGDKGPWKIFPSSGVSAEDIARTKVYGKTVSEYLQRGNFEGMQQELVSQNAVDVKPNLVFIEERAPKLFSIWAKIIIKRKNRKLWIAIFQYYLLFALFIIAPIVLFINAVFFRPFLGKSVQQKINYYSGV